MRLPIPAKALACAAAAAMALAGALVTSAPQSTTGASSVCQDGNVTMVTGNRYEQEGSAVLARGPYSSGFGISAPSVGR